MEFKTIEQIKDDYAYEQGRDDWDDFRDYYIYWDQGKLEKGIDEVSTRYASQFQTNTDLITTEICVLRDRVAELEGMLGKCKNEFQQYRDAFGQSSSLESEIESLINKGK